MHQAGSHGMDDAHQTHTEASVQGDETTRCHVHSKESKEICLWVVLGEHLFDGILEAQVKGLRWKITDAIGKVSTPEGTETLLGVHSREAVANASVSWNLTTSDERICILCLDQKLDT